MSLRSFSYSGHEYDDERTRDGIRAPSFRRLTADPFALHDYRNSTFSPSRERLDETAPGSPNDGEQSFVVAGS